MEQDYTLVLNNNANQILKYGISKDRIENLDKLEIIGELITCRICLEILNNPFECEKCGSLFCEECISKWLKINSSCPMRCPNLKINKASVNTRKILSIIQLKCINNPECNFVSNYWSTLEHEKNCEYQKIRCPNISCNFLGSINKLKTHLIKDCPNLYYSCEFCKCKIKRGKYESHLDEHYNNNSFNVIKCYKCLSKDNLCKCLCQKVICMKCLKTSANQGI